MAKRESKKNERKRRLLFLIFLFLLTLSIGGVATYAWFTSNTSVSIEALDVEVKTANGLQISADAITWSALVTKDKLNTVGVGTNPSYSGAKNQLPDVFDNVSTSGAISSGNLQMFHGTVTGDKNDGGKLKLVATGPEEEIHCTGTANNCDTKYYAAFDVFLRVNEPTDVVLTTNSGVTSLDATDKGIKNTVRVAILKQGYWSDTTTAASTMQGSKAATAAWIWEPNYDVHTATGVLNASEVYGTTTTTTGGAKLSYYGVKAAIPSPGVDITQTTTDSTHFASVATDGTVTGFTTPKDVFTAGVSQLGQLQAGITKLRIYWWVEGQDVDTENNATNSNMRLTLEFAIKGSV